MSFTAITITGSFKTADLQLGAGTVTAKPRVPMSNGADLIEAAPVEGSIVNGVLLGADQENPWQLAASNDPDTVPVGSFYTFSISIGGQALREFDAVVPFDAEGATIDIRDLEAAAIQ